MFEHFESVWSPVTQASRLKRGPISVRFANEHLVLFRDSSAKPRALLDRCPHRGVKLSLGRVDASGCIECPFHGWRFDGDGVNVGVPFNPDAKRELLAATAFPVKEAGGLVWVYTRQGAAAEDPAFPDGLVDAGLARVYVEQEWACHWTRAMENMLDMPHLPFVHRRSIGKRLARDLGPESKMDPRWTETPFGATIRDSASSAGASLEFWRPNIMVLNIPIPGRHFRIHAICVPVAPQITRMLIVGSRDFARWSVLNPLFARSNRMILEEDRAVVESSDPPIAPMPAAERSVRTDKPTLEFRKYFFSQLVQGNKRNAA